MAGTRLVMHTSKHTDGLRPCREDQWVQEARDGNQDAFTQLVLLHQDRILNTLYRMTNNMDDAMELTQETFLKAHQSMRRFSGNARFLTWLTRIAINAFHDFHRRKKVRKHLNRTMPACEEGRDPMETAPGKHPDPYQESSRHEMQRLLEKAIADLDEVYRTPLILRDIQGNHYDEIAAILGIPKGTVKSRIHRAREILKTMLQDVIAP